MAQDPVAPGPCSLAREVEGGALAWLLSVGVRLVPLTLLPLGDRKEMSRALWFVSRPCLCEALPLCARAYHIFKKGTDPLCAHPSHY